MPIYFGRLFAPQDLSEELQFCISFITQARESSFLPIWNGFHLWKTELLFTAGLSDLFWYVQLKKSSSHNNIP